MTDQQGVAWRPLLRHHHPAVHDALVNYIDVATTQGPLSAKECELVFLAAAIPQRYAPSIKRHITGALDAGASHEEIFHVIALAGVAGGVPSMRQALDVASTCGLTELST